LTVLDVALALRSVLSSDDAESTDLEMGGGDDGGDVEEVISAWTPEILALCGWEGEDEMEDLYEQVEGEELKSTDTSPQRARRGVLCCPLCSRNVGTWPIAGGREDGAGGGAGGAGATGGEGATAADQAAFNPLRAHRWFCPVLAMTSKPSIGRRTAAAVRMEESGERGAGGGGGGGGGSGDGEVPGSETQGWHLFLRVLMDGNGSDTQARKRKLAVRVTFCSKDGGGLCVYRFGVGHFWKLAVTCSVQLSVDGGGV
jgi:hypothetical protein